MVRLKGEMGHLAVSCAPPPLCPHPQSLSMWKFLGFSRPYVEAQGRRSLLVGVSFVLCLTVTQYKAVSAQGWEPGPSSVDCEFLGT